MKKPGYPTNAQEDNRLFKPVAFEFEHAAVQHGSSYADCHLLPHLRERFELTKMARDGGSSSLEFNGPFVANGPEPCAPPGDFSGVPPRSSRPKLDKTGRLSGRGALFPSRC